MARVLIIFAVFLAVLPQCFSQSLSANLTFKEELLERLNVSNQILIKAKDHAMKYGFFYYLPKFDHQQVAIKKVNHTVEALEDDTKWDREVYNTVVDLEWLVNTTVQDPYPEETLKALVVYLAAIKKVQNLTFLSETAEKHIADVLSVIEEEDFVSTHPQGWPHEHANHGFNKDRKELQEMYAKLRESINGINRVPTFLDHEHLVDWTRAKDLQYRTEGKGGQVNNVQNDLRFFESWTFELAKKFPLSDSKTVEEFYNLAQRQYPLRLSIQKLKYLNPSFQESFRERCEILDKSLEATMIRYAKQGVAYYIHVLNQTRVQVWRIQKDVERFPADPNRELISDTAREIFKYENIAKFKIEDPAPEEGFKAGAIYLAAMKSVGKNESEAMVIIETVKEIVKYEETTRFVRTTPTFPDKELQEKEIKELNQKYENLKKFFEHENIPSSADDDKLMARASAKLEQLKQTGNHKPEVEKIQKAFSDFETKTMLLNELLPIDTGAKVGYWLQNAIIHLGMAKTLEELLTGNA